MNRQRDWTLVTGDAESTDTNGWLEFQNSTVQWNILPNSGTSLWGNSCYDSFDTATSNSRQQRDAQFAQQRCPELDWPHPSDGRPR